MTARAGGVDSVGVVDNVVQRALLVKDVRLSPEYAVGAHHNIVTGPEWFQADSTRVVGDGLSQIGLSDRGGNGQG